MPGTIGTYTSWTSTGSLASILTEFFLGPLVATLNQEVMALQLFEKASVDWNGRVCTIPVHTGRNTSVEFLGESDPFVAPIGQQQYDHLSVNAHFLYGHFQITGPAIASAKKGSSGALIGWMEAEMTKLVEDVKNTADQTMISGGSCVGYIFSHNNPAGGATWGFDGDYGKLSAALTAGMTDVTINRQDEPGFQSGGVIAKNTRYLAAVDALVVVTGGAAGLDENAGTVVLAATRTDQDASGAAVATGFGYPVHLSNVGNAQLTASATQPRGVMANLSEANPFGIDKSGTAIVATGRPTLQPLVMTSDPTNGGGTNVRADLTAERIQQVLDEMSVLSGEEPDVILCHPTTRAQYVAMMTQTNSLNTTTRGGATKGDVGFLDLSYQNIPLKYSRHVPRGMMIFLNTKSWKLTELQSGSFADLDGSTLHRTGTTDAYNGFYRWYYNLVATSPNRNAILCGISIT